MKRNQAEQWADLERRGGEGPFPGTAVVQNATVNLC